MAREESKYWEEKNRKNKAPSSGFGLSESDPALKKGLPANVQAEMFCLGSIMLDDARYDDVRAIIGAEDFVLEKHRRIFIRMSDLRDRAEKIDRVTVANELLKYDELASVDGLSYLVSLDDGLPHVENVDQYSRIVRDKSILRRIAIMGQQITNRALMAEESPEEILAGTEQDLRSLSDSGPVSGGLMTTGEVIEAYPGGLNAFLDPSKRAVGVSTGFMKYDEKTGGLHDGELTILAARPGAGKTALALNMAWHVAVHRGRPTAIFSLEMTRESLLNRMLCSAARVDSHRFRMGYLNQGEREKLRKAAQELVDAPIHVDDTSQTSVQDIGVKLRRMEQRLGRPIGLCIVDYLQLLSSHGKRENRTQEVSDMSRGLKLMAKERTVPMLVLSQLSRATETRTGDHRPQLSDLRESGSIEQDADNVAFIFREEMYKRDREDLRGVAELIIGKQRHGDTGVVPLVFISSLTKFENRADDIPEDPESGYLPE